MTTPEVLVWRNADELADATAARLVTTMVEVAAARGRVHISLTGGHIGIHVLSALAASPARDSVDWGLVHLWWGDDRYVAPDDADRNERQAREALLDQVSLDPAHVHPMPSTASGLSVEDAAAHYAEELARAAQHDDHAGVPSFDVHLVGVGPEGHINSIFPESPAAYESQRWVVGVQHCPKPPPTRISMTFPAVQASREVWVLASGAEKSEAIALGLSGAGQLQVPVAGARGRDRTLYLLDDAAASALPSALLRPAGP